MRPQYEMWTHIQDAIGVCGYKVEDLHPWGLRVFSYLAHNLLDPHWFMINIGRANSDYLALGECVGRVLITAKTAIGI